MSLSNFISFLRFATMLTPSLISNESSLVVLSNEEMTTLEGGSFAAAWYDAVYCAAAFVHGLYEVTQMAGEYQSSLPACDKK